MPSQRIVVTLAIAMLAAAPAELVRATPLDDYVAAPDPAFSFDVVSTSSGSGYKTHVLHLVSQEWRSSAEVNRTRWEHWLVVVIPDAVTSETAFLLITGGSNGSSPPAAAPAQVRDLARQTGAIAAALEMVPNQPLTFAGDGGRARSEDEIIAFTFDKYMASGDGTWPALLPMAKSAVRAMDAIQTYVPDATGGAARVEKFVVSGASKRGWTTWLAAAVDARVAAIVPMVIDILNADEQMAHHKKVYEGVTSHIVGGYSDAVHDYVDLNILGRLGTPPGQDLLRIVDPYEYRDRLARPKLLINSTGDQFFVSDSGQFYLHDLLGPTYVRYIPNTDHGLSAQATGSTLSFFAAMLAGSPLPRFSWFVERPGTIRVKTIDSPIRASLWQATNPAHRDFRLSSIGAAWTSAALEEAEGGGGLYFATVPPPPTGYRAFFVELEFAAPIAAIFTTEVSVIGALPAGGQISGDTSQDGRVDISDAASLLIALFGRSPARLPCGDGSIFDPGNRFVLDVNRDGAIGIADAVYLLGWLFANGSPPGRGLSCVPIEGCPEICVP